MTQIATQTRQRCGIAGDEATIQLALVRHAHTGFQGRFCGHSDPGLSAKGREELPTIIRSLSQIQPDAIWSSDLLRARETTEPLAKHFGMDYTASSDFREMNFGLWEGLTWNQVELQYPHDARAWAELFPRHRPPGGESFFEFQARVIERLEQLAKQAEHGCTLIVTHAGFVRIAVAWVLGVPDEHISRIGLDYGAHTTLEKLGNHWMVTTLNVGASRFREAKWKTIEDQS
jgi:broad specificity phosphatase PhoE